MNMALPRVETAQQGPELWIEESIWGHRFYDEQSPWLILMEFLNVLTAEANAGRALLENTPNTLQYRPQQQLRLRNILFNSPFLEPIRKLDLSDADKWTTWATQMTRCAGGLPTDTDFITIRNSFQSFDEFVRVVRFLRSTALEYESNKRWSSKFVFPFGPNCLYEDLSVRKTSVTNDRRFFGRSGELLYLMLCRSQHVDSLREMLLQRFIGANADFDRLAVVLQGEPTFAQNQRAGAYLPYLTRFEYDKLARDWLSILRLEMPFYDVLPHLVALTGLHLVLYILTCSREQLGRSSLPMLLCEIIGPKRSSIRDLSADSYQANNTLPKQAMEHRIRSIRTTEQWHAALQTRDPVGEVANVLMNEFDWPDERARKSIRLDQQTPDLMLERLVDNASRRHAQHVGKIHGVWTRDIGLTSRRASRRNRYAPNDQLLKTLVICRVGKRMEFNEFLADLAGEYGMIIGDQQANHWVEEGLADQQDFASNARRLEERLASLGLLNRLSDSCAYVENPFHRTTRS